MREAIEVIINQLPPWERVLVERGRAEIIQIDLQTTPEDIPDDCECWICHKKAKRTYLPFSIITPNQSVIFFTLKLASYLCQSGDCGDDPPEYLAHESLIEFSTQAHQILLERGDRRSAVFFADQIERCKMHMDSESQGV